MTQAPTTFELTTEPLLELATKPLRKGEVSGEHQKWLNGLLTEKNPYERGEALFRLLRKHLLDEDASLRLLALASSAAQGETAGVAALAALLAVRAPGKDVIDQTREFKSLHRLGERCNTRLARGERLDESEKQLLAAAQEMQELFNSSAAASEIDPSALPHARDVGVAGGSRRLFAGLVQDFESKGNLDREQIQLFAKLADLELKATEMRTSMLAGAINPQSIRHREGVMPLLAALNAEVENMRAFTATLKEDPKISYFHEQLPAFEELMDSREQELLLEHCTTRKALLALRRILLGAKRNPQTLRELSFFLTHLYLLGDVLIARRARKNAIDPFEGCLLALEYVRDHMLRLPLGDKSRAAVAAAIEAGELEYFQLAENELVLPFDVASLRRSNAGVGLPLPVLPYDGTGDIPPEQSVKDLVMENMTNTTMLAGFLKNPKVVGTPGIVELIVSRTRAAAILDTICTNRHLHTGYANKGVPLALLRSPMKIPVKTLRRFVSVRYVNKVELKRLSVDVSSVRREVVDEVVAYLKSLN